MIGKVIKDTAKVGVIALGVVATIKIACAAESAVNKTIKKTKQNNTNTENKSE